MTGHWKRDNNPGFFSVFDLPWRTAPERDIVSGLDQRLISEDATTGASTSMIRIPAGWRGSPGESDITAELFVVEGSLSLDGRSLGVGSYAFLPHGKGAERLVACEDVQMYLFLTPGMEISGQDDVRVMSFWDEPWQEGLLDRKLPQRWKSLRLPDFVEGAHGSAAGLLRVMQWQPGFIAPMEHLHSTWEELIFLQGDWVAERGIIVPGSFLGNPGESWHAPVATRDGALALVHSNRPLDLIQRHCEGGEEFCRTYLERGSWLTLPQHGGEEAFAQYGISSPAAAATS
ncbi:MAG: DUF4437 domain-containing protein [Thermoleophilia bacterium]|nr:DUF4437 domain-containing protein [Thermoleophilia bacterium]